MQDPSAFPGVKLQYPEQEQLKCPRCDSANTKFCYYNNYNLSQPRHFCKSCRRYWTKGGALRNIPVGGGIRKNNKRSSNSKRSSSSPAPSPADPTGSGGNGMDVKKMQEMSGGLSLLMGSNGQFGSLLEGPGPSPTGSDLKMLSFGDGGNSSSGLGSELVSGKISGDNYNNSSSISAGYVGLQSGETSYWSGANVWPDFANFDPQRSSIQERL